MGGLQVLPYFVVARIELQMLQQYLAIKSFAKTFCVELVAQTGMQHGTCDSLFQFKTRALISETGNTIQTGPLLFRWTSSGMRRCIAS